MKYELEFKGSLITFVLGFLALTVLSALSFGLLFPVQVYWTAEFFINNTKVYNA